jgi:CRISPR-associated protein Cas1
MTTSVRHPIFGYQVTYRRAIELQARILAACLTGELAAYEPLVTR